MADHSVWPATSTPATPPAQQRGDTPLRDSVRKIRKRVASVIRRGSKTGKSRSTSVDPAHRDRDRGTSTEPHDEEHEHEDAGDKSDHKPEDHVDSGDEHLSARSRTSSTHSIRQSLFGSRSASPQPPATTTTAATSPQHNGHLTAPSSPSATTRRLSSTFGFPRSPSRKHKSKASEDGQTPSEPSSIRARTISSPGSGTGALENLMRLSTAGMGVAGAGAGKDENGRLSIPIPKRERAISQPSHPLAASPIQAASPPAEQGMVFSFGSAMEQQQQGNAKPHLVESPEAELSSPPLVAIPTPPAPKPDVIAAPAPEAVEQRSITPSTGLELSNASIASTQTNDTSVGHTRDTSVGHTRESSTGLTRESSLSHSRESSAGREPNAVLSRAASTIGSELGWSILEPTKEEDEDEDEGVKAKIQDEGVEAKAQADEGAKADEGVKSPVQIKVEDEPIKIDVPMVRADEVLARPETPPKAEEAPVKVEETPAKAEETTPKLEEVPEVAPKVEEAPAKVEETPVKVEQTQVKFQEPLPKPDAPTKVDDSVQTDDELLEPVYPERTPLEDDEELMNGAFAFSPEPTEGSRTREPTEGAPTREPSSGDLAPSGYFIDTPPRETHPNWISSVPTPPRSSTPSHARVESATPPPPRPHVEVTAPMTPPAQTGTAFNLSSAFSTPANQDSPDTPSPSRFSGTYTPYTGDQTPPPPPSLPTSDSFFHPRNVERLNPRHFERSMSTMGVFGDGEPDGAGVQERLGGVESMRPSIDTMLAPDVSVHEMISPSVRAAANGGVDDTDLRGLAGTELRDWYEGEGRTPKTVRMMLPGEEPTTNGASVSRPRSALSQSHTPPLQPPIQLQPTSQEVQGQSERAQVYSSVLSRLMSHMDRRSTLMSRLATRLGNLGGLPVVERHPREWVAQALPSGKVYYAHRLAVSESPKQVQARPASDEVAQVLVIPTPSAPQPVTLVTDLDMADNATHAGVNAFVDKCLQERDVDLPSGWEVWVHAAGASEQLDWEVSTTSGASDVSGPGEEVDLGYGAPLVLVWTYVSHKRRRLGTHGPEERFVEGEDAEFDLEMEKRYWAYVETHPAHADVNPRAVQEAIELLTWHYTDRLLAEKKRGEKEAIYVKPPFTPEESHEVLEFLKSLSKEYSHANAILKARTVARVHLRTAEWRLAKLQAVHDAVNLEVMSPAERIRRRRAAANPFVGVPLRTLAGLLGLGIPYLFVEQPDEKVEDRQRMMVADASTNLMSALMLGASVSFLAIPDLEDIARLAGVAAAACSLGSLAAGILRLRLTGGSSSESREEADEPKPSALRTFARSLPLVLSAYAGSALVAGLAAYSWRGQVSPLDDPFTRLYFDDSWRADQAGGRWFGSLVRRDGGSGHDPRGIGSESSRSNWAEASSQGIIRLWGTW